MFKLTTPLKTADIFSLSVGDQVLLSGTIFTARDRACQFLLEEKLAQLENSVIYHCGPIIKDNQVIAAGPTTSARMNSYTPELIDKYNWPAIIGKGGMNGDVARALQGRAVYLVALGGVAVLYAQALAVKNVYQPEFGMCEAIWELAAKDFPLIVGMDAKGKSLFANIRQKSGDKYRELSAVKYSI